jgi:hypothetical protein
LRWFKRGAWLAAWGTWTWLAFGLWRELPRGPGPAVARLSLEKGEWPIAFLKDTRLLVVARSASDPSRVALHRFKSIKVFDAATGRLLRDLETPDRISFGLPPTPDETCRSHGVLIARGEDLRGLHVFDLEAGRLTTLADRWVYRANLHPTKPWLAILHERDDSTLARSTVTAFNGDELFVRPFTRGVAPIDAAYFLGETDRFVVPTQSRITAESRKGAVHFELWSMTDGRQGRVVEAPYHGDGRTSFDARISTTDSGRMAFSLAGSYTNSLEVFDVGYGQQLFSHPPPHEPRPKGVGSVQQPATLSKSGKAAIGGYPVRLWNVDDGRLLWSAAKWEKPTVDPLADAFSIIEEWEFPWMGKLSSDWHTVATRRLEDGSLVRRCWANADSTLRCHSADGAYGATVEGIIHAPALAIHRPLLILCQTILALPLVALWLLLRWRRRRLERLVRS